MKLYNVYYTVDCLGVGECNGFMHNRIIAKSQAHLFEILNARWAEYWVKELWENKVCLFP